MLHQTLQEAFLYGEGVVFRPRVLAPVVDLGFVVGDVIVLLQLVERNLLAAFFRRIGLGAVVEHRIGLYFLTHPLLQVLGSQFHQFDGLQLQGRELLGLGLS